MHNIVRQTMLCMLCVNASYMGSPFQEELMLLEYYLSGCYTISWFVYLLLCL